MAVGTCPDCGFHGEYPHTTKECTDRLKAQNATLKGLVKEALEHGVSEFWPRLWFMRAMLAVKE